MKSRRRRLRIEVWYLVILAVVIVAAVLFALLFKGGPSTTVEQTPAPTQTPEATPAPPEETDLGLHFPYRTEGKWGYKSNTGAVSIEAQFSAAKPFSEGYAFAAIEKDGKQLYGIIDKTGNWVVEPLYTDARPFTEGVAAVQYNDKWGYINPQGAFLADPVFSKAGDFSGGLALVQKNGKLGYIDTTGKFKITNQYDYATDFSEGLAFVAKTENSDKKFYLITDGEEVVAAVTIEEAGVFGNGLAPVKLGSSKWAFFNRRGKQAFDATFQSAKGFSEELAAVKQDDKWGYIDTLGNMVIPAQFKDASSFSDGFAAACDENGKWGYIDKLGAWVIQPQFESAGDFAEGYALVTKALEQGLTDKYGNYKPLYVLDAPATTPDPTEGEGAKTGTVKASSLNVRKEPSTDADKVTSLKDGTRVQIIGESGEWYQIRYEEHVGYVKKEFITLD
jgi:hypothetical protein